MSDKLTLKNLDIKADNLGIKMSDLGGKVDALEVKVNDLGSKVDTLEAKVNNMDDKLIILDTKVDNLHNIFLTKEEFKLHMKNYPTHDDLKHVLKDYATKEDLKSALKEQSEDFRAMIFEFGEMLEARITRNLGALIEELSERLKGVAENLSLLRESVDRDKIENLEDHLKFDRRIGRLESTTLTP